VFPYAIAQNKDDPDTLQKNLLAIVPHAFGNHEQCNESWCGYLWRPDEYKHNGLPSGFDLSGESLQQNLEKVFQNIAKKSDRLIHIGSTQTRLFQQKFPKQSISEDQNR
jgi:hypothetical protein